VGQDRVVTRSCCNKIANERTQEWERQVVFENQTVSERETIDEGMT
jgi:hypothetical protein